MKLKWHGHACFSLTLDNGAVIVTDPFDDSVSYAPCGARADWILSTHGHHDHSCFASVKGHPEIISAAGSYDLPGAKVAAVPSWHDDIRGAKRGPNLIFRIEAGDMAIAHLGDLGHLPDTPEQKAALTGLDLMLIPIGGYYTIETPQAVEIIDTFRPRAAIGMHFKNAWCSYPITDEREFLRRTGGSTLPNEIELTAGVPAGCFVMTYR